MKKQIQRARRGGMTNLDILRVREIAKRETKEMEARAVETAFVHLLSMVLGVLASDYWPKTAEKRLPEFEKKVFSLYNSVREGVVTVEDSLQALKDIAGYDLIEEWYKGRQNEQY